MSHQLDRTQDTVQLTKLPHVLSGWQSLAIFWPLSRAGAKILCTPCFVADVQGI